MEETHSPILHAFVDLYITRTGRVSSGKALRHIRGIHRTYTIQTTSYKTHNIYLLNVHFFV